LVLRDEVREDKRVLVVQEAEEGDQEEGLLSRGCEHDWLIDWFLLRLVASFRRWLFVVDDEQSRMTGSWSWSMRKPPPLSTSALRSKDRSSSLVGSFADVT
jgi:hypothetical protein